MKIVLVVQGKNIKNLWMMWGSDEAKNSFGNWWGWLYWLSYGMALAHQGYRVIILDTFIKNSLLIIRGNNGAR